MRFEQHCEVLDDLLRVMRLRRAQGLGPDPGEREGHRGRDDLLREPIQPVAEAHDLALLHQRWHQLRQQACRVRQVGSSIRILTGVLCPSVLFIPATGSTIQFRYKRWLLLLQLCAQRFGKERMVAVPGVSGIERTDEDIRLQQALQLQLSIRLFGHALAERPGEPIQHACLEQKALHLR